MEGVEAVAGGLARLGVELERAVAAVLKEFDPSQSWAKAHMERAPVAGFTQGGAEALDGVPEGANGWHTGQEAAFPKDEVGVQVTDGGLLDLRQLGSDALLAQQVGQGGGIVAEEQDALGGPQGVEGSAKRSQAFGVSGATALTSAPDSAAAGLETIPNSLS